MKFLSTVSLVLALAGLVWAQDQSCPGSVAAAGEGLVNCAFGYGKNTGGKGGTKLVVTNNGGSDSDVGSLRYIIAKNKDMPKWITFTPGVSWTITLTDKVYMSERDSNTTIDGRGANITITGWGFYIKNAQNVILTNLRIINIAAGEDNIQVRSAKNVWLDHLTIGNPSYWPFGAEDSDVPDGAIDVVEGATNITISSCKFFDHNKVVLLGNKDGQTEDVNLRVTVANNYWTSTTVQRAPRMRYGFFDVVNNVMDGVAAEPVGGSSDPIVLLRNNVIRAATVKNVFKENGDTAAVKVMSVCVWGNQLLNGAVYNAVTGTRGCFAPPYAFTNRTADSTLEALIKSTAGNTL